MPIVEGNRDAAAASNRRLRIKAYFAACTLASVQGHRVRQTAEGENA